MPRVYGLSSSRWPERIRGQQSCPFFVDVTLVVRTYSVERLPPGEGQWAFKNVGRMCGSVHFQRALLLTGREECRHYIVPNPGGGDSPQREHFQSPKIKRKPKAKQRKIKPAHLLIRYSKTSDNQNAVKSKELFNSIDQKQTSHPTSQTKAVAPKNILRLDKLHANEIAGSWSERSHIHA